MLFDILRAGDDHHAGSGVYPAAFEQRGGQAQVGNARVGATADENHIHFFAEQGLAGLEAHISQGFFEGQFLVGVAEMGRVWHALGDFHAHAGIGAVSNHRFEGRGVQCDGFVVGRAFLGGELLPAGNGFVPIRAFGGKFTPGQVLEGGFVGSDHASARAALDGHVADRHALFHRQGADGGAGVLEHMPRAAANADFGNQGQDDVFGRDAGHKYSIDANFAGLGFALEQALGGQDVFDFTGADSEGQRAKRAVRGGVTVAADDGHAGLGEAEFRADDVNNASVRAGHAVQGDAEFSGVGLHLLDLGGGQGVCNRCKAPTALVGVGRGGRDGVVHRGDGFLGAADFESTLAQAGKSLGRGDFMHEVQVDIEDGRGIGLFGDNVGVPEFFE